MPSFTDSDPIPWALFLKCGRVVPPPKRSKEVRARYCQESVRTKLNKAIADSPGTDWRMLNKAIADCPETGCNPVKVNDLEEAVRKSVKAFYTKKRKDKNNNNRHPTGWFT